MSEVFLEDILDAAICGQAGGMKGEGMECCELNEEFLEETRSWTHTRGETDVPDLFE